MNFQARFEASKHSDGIKILRFAHVGDVAIVPTYQKFHFIDQSTGNVTSSIQATRRQDALIKETLCQSICFRGIGRRTGFISAMRCRIAS